jgi:diguanylate cyclase (GGDEF)-like protein
MTPNIASTNEAIVPLSGIFCLPNGSRVRELRQDRGWTQEELSARVGCAKRTVENIEAGRRVRRDTLEEVAEALGVKPEQITTPPRSGAGSQGSSAPAGPDRDGWVSHDGARSLPPPVQIREPRSEPSLPADGPRNHSLLVVDDEFHVRRTLRLLLGAHFTVLDADSADAAEEVFRSGPVDLILTDQRMPGRTGVQLLEWVRQHHPRTIRLLMTGGADLEAAIDAINRGHVYHYVAKPCPNEELLHVLRNAADKFDLERGLEQLLEELRRSNRELEEANQRLLQRTRELERVALTDPLTGLYNRRAIEELARFELKRHNRYLRPLTIGLIDVDQPELLTQERFQTGTDDVLEELALVLAGALREVDSIGRLHGQEFLVVARETGTEGAIRLAERIRATVAGSRFEYDGDVIPITLSVGFAVAEAGVYATLDTITALAGAALDQARSGGGNRCAVRSLPMPPVEGA